MELTHKEITKIENFQKEFESMYEKYKFAENNKDLDIGKREFLNGVWHGINFAIEQVNKVFIDVLGEEYFIVTPNKTQYRT